MTLPAPAPYPRQVCQLTCHCGTLIPDAWGPETEMRIHQPGNGRPALIRVSRCPGCARTLRWRMDSAWGVPDSVTLNPADEHTGIARIDQEPVQ